MVGLGGFHEEFRAFPKLKNIDKNGTKEYKLHIPQNQLSCLTNSTPWSYKHYYSYNNTNNIYFRGVTC